MSPLELRSSLTQLELSQSELANLISVTTRAVTMWLSGERAVPGPVVSYLRLFSSTPIELRRLELMRANRKGNAMREGMYGITFTGQESSGMGMIVLQDGRVTGVDALAVRFDGTYDFNDESGLANLMVKVTFPPNVRSVIGIHHPYEWSFDVTAKIDPKKEVGDLELKTSFGAQISAQYTYLRSIPEVA